VKKIFVYSEGQTEERFIKDLLAPHLETLGIYAQPVLATTKVVKSGPNFKGGIGDYQRAKKEILHLLGDTSACAVTTMLDYYGLDRSFPGRSAPIGNDCYERVLSVERAFGQDIGEARFVPFLTLHEFEGLLFASPPSMAAALPGGQYLEGKFQAIRQQFSRPEEIDDSPATAPHKRIMDLYPQYRKALHGPLIAARTGLNKMRGECPHLDEWIRKIESSAS